MTLGPSELTERFEDAVAGLVVIFCFPLVRRVLRQPLLPVLVAGSSTVAPAPAIALGHTDADVNGVVTCKETEGLKICTEHVQLQTGIQIRLRS